VPERQQAAYGAAFDFMLKDVVDKDGELYSIKVELNKAALFAKFDSMTNKIIIDQNVTTEELIGDYKVEVFLTAKSGLQTKYSFTLAIVDPNSVFEVKADEEVALARNRTLPTYKKPGDEVVVPKPSIKLIDNVGLMTIKFSKEMNVIKNLTELTNATVEVELEVIKKAVQFKIVPSPFSNLSRLDFEYNITSFTS